MSASTPVDFSKKLDLNSLAGKTALITGGASGIGAGLVKALAESGVFVTIADLDSEAGSKYAEELKATGHRVLFAHTDVTSWESQAAAFAATVEHAPNKKIDIVVACAGIASTPMLADGPFVSTSGGFDPPSSQANMINVNLTGTLYTTTLATYYFQQAPKAPTDDHVLILIASIAAYIGLSGFIGYVASKFGVRGLFKTLNSTPAFQAVARVNLLAPHSIRTPMTAAIGRAMGDNDLPMGEVSDCVDAMIRMCCDPEIRGRAVQVNPAKSTFDLCDDPEGLDAGKVFHEHHENETKPLFDAMAADARMNKSERKLW